MNLAERLTAADSDLVALVAGDVEISYGELRSRVIRRADALSGHVGTGERVVVLSGNEIGFVESYLAALWCGAVAVPLEPSAPAEELRRQLATVEPALVVASSESIETARQAADGICDVVDLDAHRGNPESHAALEHPVERSVDDLAALLFTSGTAGSPKAAMLTHGCLAANLDQARALTATSVDAGDVVLGLLPFFHVFGLNVVLGRSLDGGATIVLVDHFDPTRTLGLVGARGVTVLAAVPAVYAAWLALDDASDDSLATVRVAVSGATALPGVVLDGMHDRFGVHVHEGYGLTEASPIVTSAVTEGPAVAGSVGRPLPGVEIRLVDTDGADVLAGDPGEVWVRGDNVFAGYWNEPEATDRVLVDGWLHTGDIGVVLADGDLRLVDRAKDLIIVSGFNVFPAEVETALAEIPGVAAAAVVGVPDDRSGETVEAYVVAAPGATLDPRSVVERLGERLARYKLPTKVHVVAELPRTWGGKINRRQLRPS